MRAMALCAYRSDGRAGQQHRIDGVCRALDSGDRTDPELILREHQRRMGRPFDDDKAESGKEFDIVSA